MKAGIQAPGRNVFNAAATFTSVLLLSAIYLAAPAVTSAQVTSLEYQRTSEEKAAAEAFKRGLIYKPAAQAKAAGSGECTDTGEKCNNNPTLQEFDSSEFPCKGDSKAKDDAMEEVLDKLKIDPPPGCTSGGCDKRKSCSMTGLLSPMGDANDFDLVESPEGSGKCHYHVHVYKTDEPACMKATCGCK